MLDTLLSQSQRETLADERALLADVAAWLERHDAPADDREALADSIAQLDRFFLLVVVGEFNAGKSAFLNAFIGRPILAEGVTPTTAAIHLLEWGDEPSTETLADGIVRIRVPAEPLRDLSLVDTPGTNALERHHEALTEHFIPRADLVLFVTSADRPFSESERQFLERIRRWGKKVVVILNKVDILTGPEAVAEVDGYIRDHGRELLGVEPTVLRLSARDAAAARASGDDRELEASGMAEVERFVESALAPEERLRLKLLNPLGVAETVVASELERVAEAEAQVAEDVSTLADIEAQLEQYAADVEREFDLRLSDIDAELLRMEARGTEFFDERLRLGRVRELLDSEALKDAFEREVIGGTPAAVEARTEGLIDWLVESDVAQWQAVVTHVTRRRSAHSDRIVGDIGGRFTGDRAGLLETVGRAARESLATYDRRAEAEQLADDVRSAVAGAALMEVGAVGLGAAVAALATSTAADVTGLAAAGTLAVLGFVVLPRRRAKAKREFKARVSAMRSQLLQRLEDQFRRQAESNRARIRETIAPYDRFVRAESKALADRRGELEGFADRLDLQRRQVEAGRRE
jgi:small GTP-binding protein